MHTNLELESLSHMALLSTAFFKNCSKTYFYISGNPKTGGYCPIGFESGTYGLGKCYMVVRDKRPFGGAQFYCLDYGARLVSIESSKEQQFLTTLLARDKSKSLSTSIIYFYCNNYDSLLKDGITINVLF